MLDTPHIKPYLLVNALLDDIENILAYTVPNYNNIKIHNIIIMPMVDIPTLKHKYVLVQIDSEPSNQPVHVHSFTTMEHHQVRDYLLHGHTPKADNTRTFILDSDETIPIITQYVSDLLDSLNV